MLTFGEKAGYIYCIVCVAPLSRQEHLDMGHDHFLLKCNTKLCHIHLTLLFSTMKRVGIWTDMWGHLCLKFHRSFHILTNYFSFSKSMLLLYHCVNLLSGYYLCNFKFSVKKLRTLQQLLISLRPICRWFIPDYTASHPKI
jgi:hypothetical protein